MSRIRLTAWGREDSLEAEIERIEAEMPTKAVVDLRLRQLLADPVAIEKLAQEARRVLG